MGKRKSKKIARLVRAFITSLSLFLYFYILSNLLFASYTFFNLKDYSTYFLISGILMAFIPASILGFLSSRNYKRWINIIETTKGLLVAIPLVILMLFTTSVVYFKIRVTNIYKENERLFENYDKYIDFNSIEEGYIYRIDSNTNKLYYMNEHELIDVEPTYFYNLTEDNIFETYKLDKGYIFINDNKTYYTKKLEQNSEIYQINVPLTKIKREYPQTLFFVLNKDYYLDINEEYKSEQIEHTLYLYKKFNEIFYTQEKMFDLRIQIQNNFESSLEAVYEERQIIVPIGYNKYKIIFTFNDKLEVIYSREEI